MVGCTIQLDELTAISKVSQPLQSNRLHVTGPQNMQQYNGHHDTAACRSRAVTDVGSPIVDDDEESRADQHKNCNKRTEHQQQADAPAGQRLQTLTLTYVSAHEVRRMGSHPSHIVRVPPSGIQLTLHGLRHATAGVCKTLRCGDNDDMKIIVAMTLRCRVSRRQAGTMSMPGGSGPWRRGTAA